MTKNNIAAEAASMGKVFRVLRNGELFLHTQSEQDVEKFFNSLYGWCSKSYRKIEAKAHGEFEVIEDRWILRQFDAFGNEYGEEYHTILKELDGTLLLDKKQGDWLGMAFAEGCTSYMVSAASQGL